MQRIIVYRSSYRKQLEIADQPEPQIDLNVGFSQRSINQIIDSSYRFETHITLGISYKPANNILSIIQMIRG